MIVDNKLHKTLWYSGREVVEEVIFVNDFLVKEL